MISPAYANGDRVLSDLGDEFVPAFLSGIIREAEAEEQS